MKQVRPISILLALLFSLAATGLWAQQTYPQVAQISGNMPSDFQIDSLIIQDGTDQFPCSPLLALVRSSTDPWNIGFDPSGYTGCFNLERGNGMKSVQIKLNYRVIGPVPAPQAAYRWRMDGGAFDAAGSVTVNSHVSMGQTGLFYNYNDILTVSYAAGDSTDFPAVTHIFALRAMFANYDIRFKAVMIGANVTEPLGYFDTPALPLYILHDPPGDRSYAEVASSDGACIGNGLSINTTNSESGFLKVKLGVSTTIGWIVETDLSAYVQGGITVSTTQSHTTDMDMNTCLSSESLFSTSQSGAPQDLFIGRALRYLYGIGKVVSRPSCDSVILTTRFVSVPSAVLSTYSRSGSEIRNNVIPDLQDTLDILASTVGTADTLYRRKLHALEAWQNTLALNDSIKRAASTASPTSWSGGDGGGTIDQTQSLSSTVTRSLRFTTTLSTGLSAEYGLEIGGSGVNVGGEVSFGSEYATTESSQSNQGHSMHYHMEDDDVGDAFTVRTAVDSTFGTYVFTLDSSQSRTSCPFEGGYQLDQPRLWVGQVGQDQMTQDDIPIGGQAIFPIFACNNSAYPRTYELRLINQSNPNGAIISGYNGITSGSPVELNLPANSCDTDTGYIYLSQPTSSVLNFNNIQLKLSSGCDEHDISTTVSISAHFTPSTGIAAASASNGAFTVRPNPSAGRFDLVTADATNGPITVTMHDGLGRVVLPLVSFTGQRIMPIDMEGVAPGTYYLTATSADQQHVLRVMVEH